MKLVGTITAAGALALATAGSASAQPPRTCTWGGTPLAPTGRNHNFAGISNTASKHAIHFHATGPLGGQCRGTFVFDGVMDKGATCSDITIHGTARGIPGVARFGGIAVAGVGPAKLYDRHGKVVGSENAQFLADRGVVAECNSPRGVVRNVFSSVIELTGE